MKRKRYSRKFQRWLDGLLSFGEGDDVPAMADTIRDEPCGMVNLDADSASPAPEVKAVVRANQNNAGIYGAVTRTGRLAVGRNIVCRGRPSKEVRA